MKKILLLLSSITLISTSGLSAVACNNNVRSSSSLDPTLNEKYSTDAVFYNHQYDNNSIVDLTRKFDYIDPDTQDVTKYDGAEELYYQLTKYPKASTIRSQQSEIDKLLDFRVDSTSDTSADAQYIKLVEKNMQHSADAQVVATFNQNLTPQVGDPVDLNAIEGEIYANDDFISYHLENIKNIYDSRIATGEATGDDWVHAENGLVKFYTLLKHIYTAPVLKKLVYNIDILDSNANSENANVTAYTTNFLYKSADLQCLTFGVDAFNPTDSALEYGVGFWSVQDSLGTLVHETGHALAHYATLTPKGRRDLNQFDDYPQTKQALLNESSGWSCSNYNDWARQVYFPTDILGGVSPEDYLVQYIGDQLGIPAENQGDPSLKYRTLAAWSVVQSAYGRQGADISSGQVGGNGELFAEAFAQWVLTPDDKKALNWQILNDFFTDALQKQFKFGAYAE